VDFVPDATSTASAWDRRGCLALGVIGLAQLVAVLDLTYITNDEGSGR
jgi:hypothetical protein